MPKMKAPLALKLGRSLATSGTAGAFMYLFCKSKCPLMKGGILETMNMWLGIKREGSAEDHWKREMEHRGELVDVRHRLCLVNCSLDSTVQGVILGATASARGFGSYGGPLDEWTAGPFAAGLMEAGARLPRRSARSRRREWGRGAGVRPWRCVDGSPERRRARHEFFLDFLSPEAAPVSRVPLMRHPFGKGPCGAPNGRVALHSF
mmetsp:Transcript_76840/g.213477  ORF Transcript_76840/g.213477 Transcript_76840/m.213477 type:complete len:206 (+) Transcript_76840:135-752(+)